MSAVPVLAVNVCVLLFKMEGDISVSTDVTFPTLRRGPENFLPLRESRNARL